MWMIYTAIGLGSALALVVLYLLTCIRVLNEYERGVVFRLGRAMPKPKGPGLIMVFWPVDSMMRVDLRTIAKVIEPQDIITRDNVSVRVNAVLYFRVVDPMRSVLEVADFLFATSQVASEKNSTIIFPLPLKLLAPFLKIGRGGASAAALTNGRADDASLEIKEPTQPGQIAAAVATPVMAEGNGR